MIGAKSDYNAAGEGRGRGRGERRGEEEGRGGGGGAGKGSGMAGRNPKILCRMSRVLKAKSDKDSNEMLV